MTGFSFSLSTSASVKRGIDLIHRLLSTLHFFFDGRPKRVTFSHPWFLISLHAFKPGFLALLLSKFDCQPSTQHFLLITANGVENVENVENRVENRVENHRLGPVM